MFTSRISTVSVYRDEILSPYSWKMASPSAPETSRLERVLATMVAAIVGLTLVCFAATLIASVSGTTDFSVGFWPAVAALPLIGLPTAFILLVFLIVINWSRRRKSTPRTK
jgi:hypothetical protein